jgi:LuxR family maltose regulon positive regulatory protein
MPSELKAVLLGHIAQIRAIIARFVGDMVGAIALARQVLDVLPDHHPGRTFALVTLARGYLVNGDVTASNEHLAEQAVAAAGASGNSVAIVTSLVTLGRLQALQGRLRQSGATYAAALRAVQGTGGLQTLVGGPLFLVAMGNLLREQNDLETAESYLTQGVELLRTHCFDADVVLLGFTALTRLRQARGDDAGALATLDEFIQVAHARNFVAGVVARGTAARAQLWLEHGNRAGAVQWAATAGVQPEDDLAFPREDEHMTLARVLIAQGREEPRARYLDDAQQLLERLLQSAEAGGRAGSAIEILILQALALQARRNTQAAHAALERALTLAAPEGYVRSFVDEGAPMAALLAQSIERRAQHDSSRIYAERLLSAFPETQTVERRTQNNDTVALRSALERSNALAEPLSARELEILRLIAGGLSNQAIANRLVVAVSTVKKHVNNIYGKLDVQSRTQALGRARELHLL